MKKFISVLCSAAIFFTSTVNAALIPTAPTLTVGGKVFTDVSSLIVLQTQSQVTATYSTFRLPNGTSGYQVTAGKTFKVLAIQYSVVVTGGVGGFASLLYGDTDSGISGAAPTNPIFPYGTSAGTVIGMVPTDVGIGLYGMSTSFDVPAAKYISVFTNGAAQVPITIYGYEV